MTLIHSQVIYNTKNLRHKNDGERSLLLLMIICIVLNVPVHYQVIQVPQNHTNLNDKVNTQKKAQFSTLVLKNSLRLRLEI